VDFNRRIDELYGLPLAEFTASRNALAKTLSGDEARRVRELTKPTVVPWAVNQLFWKGRPAFDHLVKQGAALREMQIAALKGRDADIPRAVQAHRRALADAVGRAMELASAEGSRPDAEEVARMLEAVSLSARPPDHPGRWIQALQPAGFEALAGVQPMSGAGRAEAVGAAARTERGSRDSHRRAEAERADARRAAAVQKRLEADARSAERAVERAKAAEAHARKELDNAIERTRTAEAALAAARRR